MHDLSRLDRLVEKLKTLDLVLAMGLGYLFLASMLLAYGGPGPVFALCALIGVGMVGMGVRAGGPFRGPSAAEVETGRVPSDRRHLRPVFRVLAGILGAFTIVGALLSAFGGAWLGVPLALLLGVAAAFLALTGGGRVWVERPRGDLPIREPLRNGH